MAATVIAKKFIDGKKLLLHGGWPGSDWHKQTSVIELPFTCRWHPLVTALPNWSTALEQK